MNSGLIGPAAGWIAFAFHSITNYYTTKTHDVKNKYLLFLRAPWYLPLIFMSIFWTFMWDLSPPFLRYRSTSVFSFFFISHFFTFTNRYFHIYVWQTLANSKGNKSWIFFRSFLFAGTKSLEESQTPKQRWLPVLVTSRIWGEGCIFHECQSH